MSILPIYITGQSVLHRAAEPVERFDSSLSDLVIRMAFLPQYLNQE